MNWERYSVDGDTVWGINRFPHADGVISYQYEIRVTGENSGGRPIEWGVWYKGQPAINKPSIKLRGTTQTVFNRVADAKSFVENKIASNLSDDTRAARYKKALEEILGFATRNEARAQKAIEATEADQCARVKDPKSHQVRTIEAYARYHEAVRAFQVIKARVEEAFYE